MKRTKQVFAWLFAVIMILTVPNGVYAEDIMQMAAGVAYLDEDGNEQVYTGSYTTVTSKDTTWQNGWYVASGTVTIDTRVSVVGNVYLILEDQAELTVNGSMTVSHMDLDAGVSNESKLTISGRPSERMTQEKLGSIGIKIQKKEEYTSVVW